MAVRDSRGLETILEAPHADDEAALIADLCALIRARDPDVIENHNLCGFDLPFLDGRAATLGVPLALGRHPDRCGGYQPRPVLQQAMKDDSRQGSRAVESAVRRLSRRTSRLFRPLIPAGARSCSHAVWPTSAGERSQVLGLLPSSLTLPYRPG